MTHILFPPAGLHPAASPFAHHPAQVKPASDLRVTEPSGSDASGLNLAYQGQGNTANRHRQDRASHSAPPTILQVKINSILQEQAETRRNQMNDAPAAEDAAAPEKAHANDTDDTVSAPRSEGEDQPGMREDPSSAEPLPPQPFDNLSRKSVLSTLP